MKYRPSSAMCSVWLGAARMASSIRSLTSRLVLCSRNGCRIFPFVTKFHSEDKASRFVICCSSIFHHCLLDIYIYIRLPTRLPNLHLGTQLASYSYNQNKKINRERKLSVKQRPSFIQRSPQSNTFTVKCCKRINTSEPSAACLKNPSSYLQLASQVLSNYCLIRRIILSRGDKLTKIWFYEVFMRKQKGLLHLGCFSVLEPKLRDVSHINSQVPRVPTIPNQK